MILKIAVPFAVFNTFDYEGEAEIGSIVMVNFSGKKTWGIVVDLKEKSPYKVKKIIRVETIKPFQENFIKFIIKVAEYNIIPIGMAFKFVFNEKILSTTRENKAYSFLKDGKITEKQQNVVEFLKNNGEKSFVFNELKHLASLNIIKTLVKNGILSEKKENIKNYTIENIQLNKLSPAQDVIFNKIIENTEKPILLEGITGSGKTEIYFHVFEHFIKQNKQVLFLLPEIALTSQFISRIKSQFKCKDIAVWHSNVSDTQKNDIWHRVINNEIKMVVGARSALFLPFSDLAAIVVDEEHDLSYKQTDNGCYNARDMAILRANLEKCCVILGSATPSLESIINVKNGKYNYLFLKNRYGESSKPVINIIDLKKEKLEKDKYLSKTLLLHMEEEFKKHNQILLFMNRRGYSPIAICNECGERLICPHCSSALTFHKSKKILLCHQCEYKHTEINDCPICGAKNSIIYFGPGVEKIQEEVKTHFPDKKIALITSDTIQNIKEINDIVNKILKREIDVIIGTQMVTKGYDFPNLTLVGVLDADASLFGANFRATEKTYQLLTQVTGRAGRRKEQGKALIQTYNPENVIMQALRNNDKDIIINFEIENRKTAELPPFGKMVMIILAGKEEIKVYRKIREIAATFPVNDKIEIYGPSPMNLYKLRDEFRFKIIVKTSNSINIQKLVLGIVSSVKIENNLRLKIDVNPYIIG